MKNQGFLLILHIKSSSALTSFFFDSLRSLVTSRILHIRQQKHNGLKYFFWNIIIFSMHIPWVPLMTLLKEAPRKSPGSQQEASRRSQETPRNSPGSPQEAHIDNNYSSASEEIWLEILTFRLLSLATFLRSPKEGAPYGLWRLIFVTLLMVPTVCFQIFLRISRHLIENEWF